MQIAKIEFLDSYKMGIWLEDGEYFRYDFISQIVTARFADLADRSVFIQGKIMDNGHNIKWNDMTEISLIEMLQRKE